MRAVRDRMRKMGLFVSTKVEDFSGAEPDEPAAPKTPRGLGVTPKAGGERRRPCRGITKLRCRGDLLGLYDIGEYVTGPAHPGMEVRFGRRRCDGEQVVIKTREKLSSFVGPREEREWRENTVAQLNAPRSQGMCEYHAVYETPDKYVVVMERVRGMDLFDHLQQGHVDQEGTRRILFQMLGALKAMHASGRIHKDLKLENVVADLSSQESSTKVCKVSSDGSRTPKMCRVSSNGSVSSVAAKLIDFDTAESWEPTTPKAKDVLGTPGYIAPEAYSGDYSPASDVYSAGVVMYRLLTGRSPSSLGIFDHPPGENWVGSPAMRRIQDDLRGLEVDFERPPLNQLPDARDLVRKMMALDASERPSAAEALDHPWFWRDEGFARGESTASTSCGGSPAPPGGCAADSDDDDDEDPDEDPDKGDDGSEPEHPFSVPVLRASAGQLLVVQRHLRQTAAHHPGPGLAARRARPAGVSRGPLCRDRAARLELRRAILRRRSAEKLELRRSMGAKDSDDSDAGTCDSDGEDSDGRASPCGFGDSWSARARS